MEVLRKRKEPLSWFEHMPPQASDLVVDGAMNAADAVLREALRDVTHPVEGARMRGEEAFGFVSQKLKPMLLEKAARRRSAIYIWLLLLNLGDTKRMMSCSQLIWT